MNGPADVLHLRAAGVSLVLDTRDEQLPAVLHWGHDLGDVVPLRPQPTDRQGTQLGRAAAPGPAPVRDGIPHGRGVASSGESPA